MSYTITTKDQLTSAIERGYPIQVTYADGTDTEGRENVHGQLYVPNVGMEGCGIVYDALFWNYQRQGSPTGVSGMTLIDAAIHRDDYDLHDRYRGSETRDFIIRKQEVQKHHYNEHYLGKYMHEVSDPRYKVIAYPELTFEVIDQAALQQNFNGQGYPEYNCHNFTENTITKAKEISRELSSVHEHNRHDFFKIYNALNEGATTIFKTPPMKPTATNESITEYIQKKPDSRAAYALKLYNRFKNDAGINGNNQNLVKAIHDHSYEHTKLFKFTNTNQSDPNFVFSDYAAAHPNSRTNKICTALNL